MFKKAFTLLEVIIALFITALIIGVLSLAFNVTLKSQRQGKDMAGILRRAELLISQMTMELKSAVVHYYNNISYITFLADSQYVYFMSPVDNSSMVDLCELGYLYDSTNKEIDRHFVTYGAANNSYEYLSSQNQGRVDYSTGLRKTFCENVSDFRLRYQKPDGSWVTSWNDYRLPVMVEVNAEIYGDYPENDPTLTKKQKKRFTTWIYLPNSRDNPV